MDWPWLDHISIGCLSGCTHVCSSVLMELKTRKLFCLMAGCKNVCLCTGDTRTYMSRGQVGWMLADHRDGLSSSSFLAWSSIAQSVCQWAFSLLAIWCLRPWWVRILPSAEEDNLSPFDSNIACLCQSIEINNNRYVCRQGQVRKSTDSGVKWAECSLIIGTGCRVQVFSLILDSSVGLSAGIQSAGDLVSETLMGSNPAFSRGRQLVSFRFEYRLPVPEHRN